MKDSIKAVLGRKNCFLNYIDENLPDLKKANGNWKSIDAGLKHTIGRLKWAAAKHSVNAGKLADKLVACSCSNPCFSGACPRCVHLASNAFTALANRFLRNRHSLYAVTIIIPARVIPIAKIKQIKLASETRALQYLFDKTGVKTAVGVVELGIAEHAKGDFPSSVVPHFHGIIQSKDIKRLRNAFRAELRGNQIVKKPIYFKLWDYRYEWLSYCLKTTRFRRRTIEEVHRFDSKTSKARICRGTNTRWLTNEQLIDLSLLLDGNPLPARLLLRKCRIRKNNSGVAIASI